MEHPSWTVVQFEDHSVEAVPTSWIDGDFCHWPPYSQTRLSNAIKKNEMVNTHWPSHRISIFRNATFDDYNVARRKTKAAEDGSDLNSDAGFKRRHVPKKFSSSEDEDSSDEGFLARPPVMKMACAEVSGRSDASTRPQKKIHIDTDMRVTQRERCLDEAVIDSTPTKKTRCCCNHGECLNVLQKQLNILKYMITDLLGEMKELKSTLPNTQMKSTHRDIFAMNNINVPIENEDGIERVEFILRSEDVYRQAVEQFSKYGGNNIYDFIKRVLSSLVKDTLLEKYSWLGRKGKMPLSKMLFTSALIDAAVASMVVDRKTAEEAMKRFTKRAHERLMK